MKPADFVTQVYNVQEGVILDELWPCDDKYREVIYQANLVIPEFTKQADWSWLREQVILGDTNPLHPHDLTIPKYEVPEWAERVSTLYEDAVRLYPHTYDGQIMEDEYEVVPFVSKGAQRNRKFMELRAPLQAKVYGRYLTLNRKPQGHELNKVLVCDVQRKMNKLHICNEKCTTKDGELAYVKADGSYRDEPLVCKDIEEEIFEEEPSIQDYMVWKTAYNTSKYSPIAGGIRGELNDNANKILSKIRQIDAAKTSPDIVKKSFNFKAFQVF